MVTVDGFEECVDTGLVEGEDVRVMVEVEGRIFGEEGVDGLDDGEGGVGGCIEATEVLLDEGFEDNLEGVESTEVCFTDEAFDVFLELGTCVEDFLLEPESVDNP